MNLLRWVARLAVKAAPVHDLEIISVKTDHIGRPVREQNHATNTKFAENLGTDAIFAKPLRGIGSGRTADRGAARFRQAGFRSVPGSVGRHSAFIAPGVILMPSFVNLGAYVDSGAMVDTWATVGSCAQIGKDCHLSGGVGIGGVLAPLQADPVIIEDNCFIGARSEVAEGVIIETGAVLAMGCYIGQSTKIVDRESGEIHMGRVPAYSVVVPGSMPSEKGGPNLYCCVIVKTVDEQTRAKTSINDLLRD